MALYSLGEIKKQVALMVGHDGLAIKVGIWTNRVVQDISSRIYWKRLLSIAYVAPWDRQPVGDQAIPDMWGGVVVNSTQLITDCINVFRVEHVLMNTSGTAVTYRNGPVPRSAIQDLYSRYEAQNVSLSGPVIQQYAIPCWDSAFVTGAQTVYVAPNFAVYPMFQNTSLNSGGALEVTYLRSPQPILADSDPDNTNIAAWMFKKYFKVVLNGVMCYARIYVGDIQGYLLEKSEFENGIQEMIRHEETVTADTPVRQSMSDANLVSPV